MLSPLYARFYLHRVPINAMKHLVGSVIVTGDDGGCIKVRGTVAHSLLFACKKQQHAPLKKEASSLLITFVILLNVSL